MTWCPFNVSLLTSGLIEAWEVKLIAARPTDGPTDQLIGHREVSLPISYLFESKFLCLSVR